MRKGYVISDLHMMAEYSRVGVLWKKIEAAAAKADFFVINGDMYELYYSRVPFEERVQKAVDHLEAFVKRHPDCEFHFNIGNHEDQQRFIDKVKALDLPNLTIHDNAFRLGNALYVHGDSVLSESPTISRTRNYYPNEDASRRNRKDATASWRNVARAGAFFQKKWRDNRNEFKFPGDSDLDKFLEALAKAPAELRDGVQHVFYGHTHDPKWVENHDGSGITFHNTGAGVRGSTFNMLELEADDSYNITNVTSQVVEARAGRHEPSWTEIIRAFGNGISRRH